jgi:ribosomal protein L35
MITSDQEISLRFKVEAAAKIRRTMENSSHPVEHYELKQEYDQIMNSIVDLFDTK